MAQFMNATGVQMVHVPYKGEGPLTPDSSRAACSARSFPTRRASSSQKKGRLRVSGARRPAQQRAARTCRRSPSPACRRSPSGSGPGVFGPAKMPREIVERLNKALNAVVSAQDVIERMQSYGYVADSSTPRAALSRSTATTSHSGGS